MTFDENYSTLGVFVVVVGIEGPAVSLFSNICTIAIFFAMLITFSWLHRAC